MGQTGAHENKAARAAHNQGEVSVMIIVVVEVKVDSGAAAKVKDAITKMETATRQEAGCVTYAFSVDVSDDTTIRVIERWKSMDDIRSHMASPHMAEFMAAFAGAKVESASIRAYEGHYLRTLVGEAPPAGD